MNNPKTLFIDMDNVLVDFPSGIARLDDRTRTEYDERLDEVPGIFALMEPMPGALEAYSTLCQHFDTYILSTAPWENPSAWSDKLLWVQRHLNHHAYKRLILSHNKQLNHGHFLVDDRPKNGAEHFRGEWIHFGTEKFPDWPTATAYLLQRK
jgi:5'-nucleotidase